MPLPTPTPFQKFRSLIFRHDPLNLEEQLVFWLLAQFAIQENDLHTSAGEFLDEKDLIGVLAR